MCSTRPLGPLRVKKRRFDPRPVTSGLPLSTDIVRPPRHVSKVPISEVVRIILSRCWRSLTDKPDMEAKRSRGFSKLGRELPCRQITVKPRALLLN